MLKETSGLSNTSQIEKNEDQLDEQGVVFKTLERKFSTHDIINERDGKTEFDLDTLCKLKISSTFLNGSIIKKGFKPLHVTGQYLLDFFRNKHGVAKRKIEEEKNNNESSEDKPFFSLPKNIEKAKNGEFEDGLIAPWELMAKPDFSGKIKLDSGEEASLVDFFYLKKIKELQFQRDENGDLNYFDQETQKFEKFYSGRCDKIFGRDISFTENGKLCSLTLAPELFIKKYLPLVDSLDVFKSDDFKRIAGTKSADILFVNDKKFNSKSPYYGTSISNDFARYYIGREKIVGTDRKIEDSMALRELSKDLVGITQEEHGRKKLLYTFEKLNKEEFEQMGFPSLDNDKRTIGGKEMKERIKEYKISDYLPRHVEETPEDYANRLSNLNDIDFVTGKFRSIMAKAEIPLRNLTWSEQLAIANYSLEGNKEERLVDFASKYGIEGLRAFLAVESDRAAGQRILEIGEKLPEQANRVFSKVNELNSIANKEAKELVDLFLKDGSKPEAVSRMHGDLLKKSNDILIKFDSFLSGKKKTDNKDKNIDLLLAELESKQVENSVLVSILKSLKENGVKIDFEIIKHFNLLVKQYGEDIDKKDKDEVKEMAQVNWSEFGNPKMAKVVEAGLAESLDNNQNQKYYILKYQNKVAGFARFEKTGHEAVYFGSFNVSQDLRGLSIGNDMMEKVLVEEGKHNILEATASIKIPAGCAYIDKIGFVADGIIPDYHKTGEVLFTIRLDNKNNQNYSFKNEGKKEPIDKDDLKKASQDYKYLDNLIGRESFVLRFDLNSEMAEYQKTLTRLLVKADDQGNKLEAAKDKYTLTRYFYDKQEDPKGNIRYLVFEKNH